jgi:MFS family permease
MPASAPQRKESSNGRWLTRGVLGIGLASLFSDWGHEIGSALLPLLLASLGAPAYALGVIEGVADGASSFAKLAGGWIADRPAWRKPVAVLGYLLTGLSTFAFGFVTAWPQILVARAIGWTGRGARGPARDVLLADAVSPAQTGRAFGFERTMDTAGAVLGPLCAMALAASAGLAIAMRWTLVPGALAALSFAALVPARRRTESCTAKPFWASLAGLPAEFRKFLFAVALFGLGDFAHTLLILRAVQLLTPQHGAARAGTIGVALYTFHNVIYAAGSYPAGALGDRASGFWSRLGRRGILASGYLLAAVMCAGFMILPRGRAPHLFELIGLFGVAGLYVAIQDTLEKVVAADLLPREMRATGFGVLATVNGIGDLISSVVVGFLWSAVSPAAGFAYAGALMALGGIFVARLPVKRKHSGLSAIIDGLRMDER